MIAAASAPWRRAFAAYAQLVRLESAVGPALLAYGVGTGMGSARGAALAAAVAVALALAGGHAYNDLRDQRLDRINRPSRPLVSGRIPEAYARRLVAILFAGALLAAAGSRSPRTFLFILLLLVSSCVYSDLLKPLPGVKNAFVGLWCGVMPWAAALDFIGAAVLPGIALVALFITQKELVADVRDLAGDAAAGVRTIPLLLGARAALALAVALNVALAWLAYSAGEIPLLVHLPRVMMVVAAANVLALLLLRRAGAYVLLQKALVLGGCVGLFAALCW
jgi:4-hydroxybenzoate polyprenyltransferase